MINIIIHGVSLGLLLSIMIGPVFFLLLNTSIKKGFKPAAYLAAGVALSDMMFIIIAYYGSTLIGTVNKSNSKIGWIGGLLLITFGLISIFKKTSTQSENIKLPDDSRTLFIDTGKGFVMNSLNPFVLVFWIGVITALNAGTITGKPEIIIFFIIVIVTVFSTDLLKAYLAIKIKKLMTTKLLLWLNRLSGLALIFYGIKLIFDISRAF